MKVDRLVSIIMILLDKERIGAQELADMFEVSPRTIYRDIDAINLSGVPIRAVPGVGGGFEIMPNYKLDHKVFSANDLSTILMGLSSLSDMMQGNEMVNALAKIKSFIPAEQAKAIEIKANQIHIDPSPWLCNKNIQSNLELIQEALQHSQILLFDYADHNGTKTSRKTEPYQLILKNSHWYCQAYCLTRNDFRLFKLSRITNLQVLDDTFSLREYQAPQLDFTNYVEALQSTIKIRIHRSIMDMVLDYCSFDHFSEDGDSHYLVDFPFIENDYYYNILFSFGDQCECLAPSHIRNEMKRKLQAMALLYER